MVDGPPQPADDDSTKARQRRRLDWRLAGGALLALGLLVVLLLACVLWIPRWLSPSLAESDLHGVSDAAKVQELKGARLKLQNDARTTLLQGLGALLVLTGATAGVWATLRQVRASHDQLKLSEQGQVTDRYTRAVEQLGHEKAPVRLGALYSLDHLAQDNPEYRQTVVDVFCAYLRMPYTLPAQTKLDAERVEEVAPRPNDRGRALHPDPAPGRDPAREELQVRQTAQRLLVDHLRCPPRTSGQDAQLLSPSPEQVFWPGISLDLTGATLVDFNVAQVSVTQARFAETTFQGNARFAKATFQDNAWFTEATFQDDAWFTEATFQGDAWFTEATFQGEAWFGEATFQGDAWFTEATFQGNAWFAATTFQSTAWFSKAIFQGTAPFAKATFQGDAGFGEATFQSTAWFAEAAFHGEAWFRTATFQSTAGFAKATFRGDTVFRMATFQSTAWFAEATFEGDIGFDGAYVLHLDDLDRGRVWPDGWTVRPDPTDPSRGTLVKAEQPEEPEQAVPPSESTDR